MANSDNPTPATDKTKEAIKLDNLPGYQDLPPFRDKFDSEKFNSAMNLLWEVVQKLSAINADNWRADYALRKIQDAIDMLQQDVFDAFTSQKPANYEFSGIVFCDL